MAEEQRSLIIAQEQAAGMQPVLFDLPAHVQEQLAIEGRYTAERLWRDRPETYKAIVTMLAEKRGVRAIKRACRVHHETIKAVAARERIAIDTEKERIVADLQAAALVGAERMVDVMETIKPEYLATAIGITVDKMLLLSGEATSRIETVSQTKDAPKTWDEWLAKVKPAQAREITGCGEGEGGEMGGAGGGGAAGGGAAGGAGVVGGGGAAGGGGGAAGGVGVVGGGEGVVVHWLEGAGDRVSDVSQSGRVNATGGATDRAADRAVDVAAVGGEEAGGGGGRGSSAGGGVID